MQATPAIHHPFPLSRTLAVMSAVAIAVTVVQVFVTPWIFGHPDGGLTAVLAMSGLVWISSLLSVLPMVREQGRGPLAVVKVFFMGMAVRAVIAVVAIILAVKRLSLPLGPSGVATMMLYLPLLFVETRILADYVRRYDALQPKSDDQPGGGTNATDDKPAAKTVADRKDHNDNTAPCTEALA